MRQWLVCLACITVTVGCGKAKKEADAKKDVELPIPVEVQPIVRGPIESTLRTFATLEAEQEVKVFGRTANRVVELDTEEGDEVTRDQVLLRLDDTNQQVMVAKARNAVAKSRQEFERLKALHDQQLISDQVFTDSQFELRQLELAVDEAQRELDYTVVRAPIDGTIAQRLVKLGDLVTVNQQLFSVVDFRSIVARIYVPEKNLASLATNQLARVTAMALADRGFQGKVRRISPVVDAKSGTIKVTLGFDDIGPLRPGMYVDVELILDKRPDALLISKRALILDGDQTYAFRLGENRRVHRILVEPRVSDRMNVEPSTGFAEGDRVVVAGQTGLKEGALVRLPEDPEPDANKKDGGDGVRVSAK